MNDAPSPKRTRKVTSKETPSAKSPEVRREFAAGLPAVLGRIAVALHDVEVGEPQSFVRARALAQDLGERAAEHGFEGVGCAAQALAELLERFAEPLAKEEAMQLHASLTRVVESMSEADQF